MIAQGGDRISANCAVPLRAAQALCTAVAAVCLLLAIAPAAQADGLAGYLGHTGSEPAGFGAGEIAIPRGMGLNQTGAGDGAESGDLYVADVGETGDVRVDQFNASGEFVRAFGWGVIDGSNAYQICTTVCHSAVESSPPDAAGAIGNAGDSIAVDQSNGNVFVSDSEKGRIDVFNSSGGFEGAIGWGVATEASALEFCTVTCHFGTSGSAAGQIERIGGLAVDPTTGNLLVADRYNNRVDEFSLALNGSNEVDGVGFVLAFGWGVDTGAEAFETCTTASTCQAGLEGEHLGEFGGGGMPEHIAVNSAGVIYAVDSHYDSEAGISHNRVEKFTPSGESYVPSEFAPLLLAGSGEFSGASSVYVASNDHVFLTIRYPSGSPCPDGGSSTESEARILELNSSGDVLATHAACAGVPFSNALAADTSTSALYADTYQEVYIFAPTASPTSEIDSVTPNTTGATVTGAVNPNDSAHPYPHAPTTAYQVEYKRTIDSTWSKFLSPIDIGNGASDVPVAVHLGGLQSNTEYEVRLTAIKRGTENGYSATQTFVTLPVPPSVEAFSALDVTATTADLHAVINPHGTDTTYHFEYGTTNAFGQSTSETDLGSSLNPQSVDVAIEGLESTVYYFRVVAHNSLGTTTTGTQTFSFYPPDCPNTTVREQTGSQHLPDCRAYELVSPEDSGGAVLGAVPFPSPYATHPARFGFGGRWGAIPGANTIDNSYDPYVSTRTDTGWVTKYVGIPGNEALSAEFDVGSLDFEKFIDFKGGFLGPSSPIPYVWDFEGNFLGRWPADFASVSHVETTVGAFQPSPDFSHLAFSSNNVDFDPNSEGLTTAPGSAYDYDVATGTTTLISRLANGEDIPQVPTDASNEGEYIRFPALYGDPAGINPGVSTDGSHILMSTYVTPYEQFSNPHPPVRLYMSVDDLVTYEVSTNQVTDEPADVQYVGMTSDGTKVFFTSNEELTEEDKDASTDLYMWSQAGEESGHPLTLISKGDNDGAAGEPGNADNCVATWTAKCDATPIEIVEPTDNSIAAEKGSVYFYSPELLDGPENGLEGAQNLYEYRDGQVEFVALLNSDGSGPATRFQVSPDGEHAAFVTKSKLTSFENAGFAEMYSYSPATGELLCVSCRPSGEPPTSNVEASQNGLFMSNDGRVFWATADPLVQQDTDHGTDVYEYVDGRPQLITSGTSAQTEGGGIQAREPAGLAGVSADGVNVYFSTYDTLVPQDHNGPYLKFYDARTDGGFLVVPTPAPCVAADECHGAKSTLPAPPAIVSAGSLGSGGNAVPSHRSRAKKHRRHKRHRHHSKARRAAHHPHHRSRSNG